MGASLVVCMLASLGMLCHRRVSADILRGSVQHLTKEWQLVHHTVLLDAVIRYGIHKGFVGAVCTIPVVYLSFEPIENNIMLL